MHTKAFALLVTVAFLAFLAAWVPLLEQAASLLGRAARPGNSDEAVLEEPSGSSTSPV